MNFRSRRNWQLISLKSAKQCLLHRRFKTQIHARYEILPLKQKDFIKRESTMKQTKKCLEEEPFYKTFLPDTEQFEKIKKVNILQRHGHDMNLTANLSDISSCRTLCRSRGLHSDRSQSKPLCTFSIKDIDGLQ